MRAGDRAVITGLGVVSSAGMGEKALWGTALSGESRIGPISLFDASSYPVQVAGEVPDFDVATYLDKGRAAQMDRWSYLGMAACELAIDSAGLPATSADPYGAGVCLASSSGGNIFGQHELQRLWSDERRTVSAYQSIAWFYAATVGQASIRHQYKFQSSVLVSEAAGAIDSVAQAARSVRRGGQVVLAGATECPLSPYALVCHLEGGLLAPIGLDTRGYAAYTDDACGHVLGEGGAVFTVEPHGRAAARGADVRAEIAGWAATHDGLPWMAEEVGHDHLARAIELALGRAGLEAGDVAAVVPDAVGVARFDRAEARALQAVGVTAPVSSIKPAIGRGTQGAAAIDIAMAVLMLEHDTVPAFAGAPGPDAGFGLDLATQARPLTGDHVLVVARGRDGFNSALVVSRGTAHGAAAGTAEQVAS